jgi:hypothetical protein
MRHQTSKSRQCIGDLVDSIPALARGDLLVLWEQYYGTPPDKMISTKLLVRAVTYAVQVEQQGGLAKRTRKELLRLAGAVGVPSEVMTPDGLGGSSTTRARVRRAALPQPGTRFVREWNGKSHVVEVVDKGFAWQGQTYRSLSAIASLITGTRWSGPRFFGTSP